MEIFDLNKLETAIIYMDRLADGKDPVNNTQIDHVPINDPNVIRCLWFVKEVLQAVSRNNGKVGPGKPKAAEFPLECLEKFQYEGDKSITYFLNQLKDLAEDPQVKGIAPKRITDWLKAKGYLDVKINKYTGKNETVVTEAAGEFGIYTEPRVSSMGREYNAVLYNQKAQEYLVSNMQKILDGEI